MKQKIKKIEKKIKKYVLIILYFMYTYLKNQLNCGIIIQNYKRVGKCRLIKKKQERT